MNWRGGNLPLRQISPPPPLSEQNSRVSLRPPKRWSKHRTSRSMSPASGCVLVKQHRTNCLHSKRRPNRLVLDYPCCSSNCNKVSIFWLRFPARPLVTRRCRISLWPSSNCPPNCLLLCLLIWCADGLIFRRQKHCFTRRMPNMGWRSPSCIHKSTSVQTLAHKHSQPGLFLAATLLFGVCWGS